MHHSSREHIIVDFILVSKPKKKKKAIEESIALCASFSEGKTKREGKKGEGKQKR